jgi:hypothetical protein
MALQGVEVQVKVMLPALATLDLVHGHAVKANVAAIGHQHALQGLVQI